MINHFVDASPHTELLCDSCWRRRRQEVGAEMMEGPIKWGEDWPEVLEWIERNLAYARSPRLRYLTAFELARHLPHLPTPIPDVARRLLAEFGFGAS